MDKNTFIGLLLIAAIVIGFSILNAPSDEEIAAQKRLQDSLEQVEAERLRIAAEREAAEIPDESEPTLAADTSIAVDTDSLQTVQKQQLYGVFAGAQSGSEKQLKVETDLFSLYFNTKGGQVERVVLKDYETYEGEPLVLFDSSSTFNLNFFSRDNKNIYTDELIYHRCNGPNPAW